MRGNNGRTHSTAIPVEKHDTASWISSIEDLKPISNVAIPAELEVHNAKEWVDSNKK